jgi:SAM-dependent methyltransferase
MTISDVEQTTREPKAERSAVDFRNAQRELWNGCAGGWRKWSELIDHGARGISERLVELAGVRAGSRVLDVACGYGEPALVAARAASPGGSVVATDIAAGMIAFGRERSEAAGLANIEFVVSDAASLAVPERSFDAAISRFGLIFEPEPDVVAARIRNCLEPGGRLSLASWGPPDRVPFLGIPLKTAIRELGAAPPPKNAPGPFARPSRDTLSGLLEAGGFVDITSEERDVTFVWKSMDDFIVFIEDTVPPITALMSQHPPDAQARAWNAVRDAVGQLARQDGTLSLDNCAILASGARSRD